MGSGSRETPQQETSVSELEISVNKNKKNFNTHPWVGSIPDETHKTPSLSLALPVPALSLFFIHLSNTLKHTHTATTLYGAA